MGLVEKFIRRRTLVRGRVERRHDLITPLGLSLIQRPVGPLQERVEQFSRPILGHSEARRQVPDFLERVLSY